MAKICKYCGKESPNASKKCKYCSKPFATVKPQDKASTKKDDKTKKASTKKDDKTTKKPTSKKDDKTTKKPSTTKANAKKDGKTSATKAGNKKDNKALLTKPKAKKNDKTKTSATKPAKKSVTVKPAKKEIKTTAKTAKTTTKKTTASKSTPEKPLFGTDELELFTVKGYLRKWESFAKGGNAGIILTNTSGLSNTTTFLNEVKKYCAARKPYARYALLDLNNLPEKRSFSDCPSVVALLKEIYKYAVPTYLMIVGDPSVIPFMNWENRTGDSDKFVPSDLPYITLDTRTPFDGYEYSFQGATKVGRIPASPVNSFSNAIKYFQFAANYKAQTSIKPFAITAEQWISTSKNVFSKLKCDILSSPNYTCRDYWVSRGYTRLPNLNDRNLLGFNLHGANTTDYWYGQKGNVYPEAYDPLSLPDSKSGYTICVEACYGARPKIENASGQSIVVTALSNNCVAFVGSTRIAYGAVSGSMSCADIIAYSYFDSIMNSKTSGQSFLDSLSSVSKSGRDENSIKTIAEFALYGDPSIVVFSGNKELTSASTAPTVGAKMVKTKANAKKAIRLIPCDSTVMKATSSFYDYAGQISKAEGTIKTVTAMSDSFVAKNFAEAQNVKPTIFKVADSDEYRTIYKTTNGKVTTFLKLHVDGKGKVIKSYISK